jgi:hypothetical protein
MSLTKVIICAYDDKKLQKMTGEFRLPINPENFSRDLKVKNDETQAQGASATAPKTNQVEPEEIKLEFIFDNTGTVQGNHLDGTEVADQIADFLKVVYDFKDKIHEPRKLKVIWGDFKFDCKLTALSINYTLFKPDGKPLRAKLSGTFRGYVEDQKRVRKENKQSPDLTHVRTFSGEEALHYLTYDIYGNNKYYLQVAKVNQLTSPRLIETGRELIFPPIKKSTDE